MARIRTIKPDAFKSESLSAIPRGARWTFAGLWTYVDDSGVGRADARLIAAELYPLDDRTTVADVEDDLSQLTDAGCIHTYMSGGKVYLHIPEFLRHQRISHPSQSYLPPCSCLISGESREPSGGLPEPSAMSGANLPEPSGLKGKGKGREKEREGERASAPRPHRSCAQHPNGTDDPCGRCKDARTAHDTWRPPTFTGPRTKCGDHPQHPALNCPECAAQVAIASPEVIAQIKALVRKSA